MSFTIRTWKETWGISCFDNFDPKIFDELFVDISFGLQLSIQRSSESTEKSSFLVCLHGFCLSVLQSNLAA